MMGANQVLRTQSRHPQLPRGVALRVSGITGRWNTWDLSKRRHRRITFLGCRRSPLLLLPRTTSLCCRRAAAASRTPAVIFLVSETQPIKAIEFFFFSLIKWPGIVKKKVHHFIHQGSHAAKYQEINIKIFGFFTSFRIEIWCTQGSEVKRWTLSGCCVLVGLCRLLECKNQEGQTRFFLCHCCCLRTNAGDVNFHLSSSSHLINYLVSIVYPAQCESSPPGSATPTPFFSLSLFCAQMETCPEQMQALMPDITNNKLSLQTLAQQVEDEESRGRPEVFFIYIIQ